MSAHFTTGHLALSVYTILLGPHIRYSLNAFHVPAANVSSGGSLKNTEYAFDIDCANSHAEMYYRTFEGMCLKCYHLAWACDEARVT